MLSGSPEAKAADLVRIFWAAAAANDSAAISGLSSNTDVLGWVAGWSKARPGYFARTAESLQVMVVDRSLGPPDTLEVAVHVSESYCDKRFSGDEKRVFQARILELKPKRLLIFVLPDIC